ncbi:HTH-type transcriptional repressor AllR [Devosia equisanguinis]|uniref:HTH-type transcriptional repressor AllR n=1 Tax=Devosia equisanguinis TaxID=2490941 RepID=A0A3S4CSS9_9HYPH|nr:HTH-type transcriptional repressor AllR [Devosia equisanguinis]
MDTVTRLVSIFDLFDAASGPVKVDEIAAALDCSIPTAYRYLKALTGAGLASQNVDGGYGLGPRIIQLDRTMRRNDPFLVRSGEVMAELLPRLNGNLMVCAYYAGNVVCIDQAWPDRTIMTSYDRGRAMPLLRGAAGKAILAHLPHHRLRGLMADHADEILKAGLGKNWAEFSGKLKAIRSVGYSLSMGEVDPQNGGIAAPIFDENGKVRASLVLVMPAEQLRAADLEVLSSIIRDGAARISHPPSASTEA